MTGRDERLARQWAVDCQGEGKLPAYGIAAQAAARYILSSTAPTMADIEWVDSEHTFAGATVMLDSPTEVVMLSERDDDSINIALLDGRVGNQYKEHLTPSGKRYGMHEIGEHPETLKDEEDYETAPVGTVVQIGGFVAISRGYRWSTNGVMNMPRPIEMAWLGEGEVLKWGKQ